MTDIIIGDAHVPFQDNDVVRVVMKLIRRLRPDNVIMNGDMLDCVQLSRFNHAPLEPSSLGAHVVELGKLITAVQKYANVIYIEGNHEARVQKYINDNAPELHGLIDVESLINNELRAPIQYVRTVPTESMLEWHDDLLIGHFNIARKYTCYTAKALIERFQTNIVQGHTHRLGEYSLRTWGGNLRGFEGGCLCNLDPEYVMHPNWCNGALVYTRDGGAWNIEITSIVDGECIFRGSTYSA